MSGTPREYSGDEDIAQYVDNKHDSDSIAHSHKRSTNARAGEGPVDIDEYNGDGKSVYGSSNTGESDESWSVSSVADLDPSYRKLLNQRFASENFYFI